MIIGAIQKKECFAMNKRNFYIGILATFIAAVTACPNIKQNEEPLELQDGIEENVTLAPIKVPPHTTEP